MAARRKIPNPLDTVGSLAQKFAEGTFAQPVKWPARPVIREGPAIQLAADPKRKPRPKYGRN